MTMSPKAVIVALLFISVATVEASRPKVIYGEDNRILIGNSKNANYKKWAKATAGMFPNPVVQFPKPDSKYPDMATIYDKVPLGYEYRLCKGERFSKMINPATCSGFLVEAKGEQYLVTAGHCMRDERDCESNKWIFGFTKDKIAGKYNDRAFVPTKDIYSCSKIVDHNLDYKTESDYSVVKLDRKVEGVTPLKFRKEGRVDPKDEMVVIGHPSGLPTIVSDNARVRNNDNDFYFVATLDTFTGNSGSAVLNRSSGEVEGILVRGEDDYEFLDIDNENGGCYVPVKCEEDGCRGEDVTRITNIEFLTGRPGPVYAPTKVEIDYNEDIPEDFADFWFNLL